jgi:hypothetical protein
LIVDIPRQVEQDNRFIPRNQKLTKLMAGRTIKGATVEPGAVLVVFDDQSNMKIKASWTSNDTARRQSKIRSGDQGRVQNRF